VPRKESQNSDSSGTERTSCNEVAGGAWSRLIGDGIFALGTVGIGWFVLGLKTGWSFAD